VTVTFRRARSLRPAVDVNSDPPIDPAGAITAEDTDRDPTAEISSPQPGVALVVLGGEHDFASARQLEDTLTETLPSCSHLIVDLSAVQFIDSTTIKVLLNTKKAADEHERSFNLVLGTAPLVENVLKITGVLPALNRVHSLHEALQSS